jgi:hypothetical protein
MKHDVLAFFKDEMRLLEIMGTDKVQAIIKPHFGIFVARASNRDRIARFVIFGNEHFLDNLCSDFGVDGDYYGEVMLRLLQLLIREENEHWIIDTDALNWDVNFGRLRYRDDLADIQLLPGQALGEIPNYEDLMQRFDDCDEMIVFMNVSLKDWMS